MLSFVFYGRPTGIAGALAVGGYIIWRGRGHGQSADGWVYLLHCPEVGAYKIGWSGDTVSPKARVTALIGEARTPVRLICYGQGSRLLEQSLHDRFRSSWVSTNLPAPTEWFRLEKSEAAEVAALLKARR